MIYYLNGFLLDQIGREIDYLDSSALKRYPMIGYSEFVRGASKDFSVRSYEIIKWHANNVNRLEFEWLLNVTHQIPNDHLFAALRTKSNSCHGYIIEESGFPWFWALMTGHWNYRLFDTPFHIKYAQSFVAGGNCQTSARRPRETVATSAA